MTEWKSYGVTPNSKVDNELVSVVEKKLGASLPETYLDLVKFNDEAVFDIGVFEYDGGATCISEFLKFTDKAEPNSILWYLEPGRMSLPKGFLPIARDAGDYLICLDYSSLGVPVKLYLPNEAEQHTVSRNFSEFISNLHE